MNNDRFSWAHGMCTSVLPLGLVAILSAPGIAPGQDKAAETLQAGDTQIRYGQASRFDRSNLTLPELARAMVPSAHLGTQYYTVPNQFPEFPEAALPVELTQDPLAGSPITPFAPMADQSFDGPSSDDNAATIGGRIQPPDTNCDTGRENVVCYVNLVVRVFDKVGNPIGAPLPGNAFWSGFGGVCETNNNGDPVVVYDHLAKRWLFTQFAPFAGTQCFAISEGEDPLGAYTRYAFVVEPNAFNDYPKVGLWVNADGSQSAYTYTGRNFVPQGNPAFAQDVSAVLFDRDAMLAGAPNAGFLTRNDVPGGFSLWDGLQPGHIDNLGTAPGDACPLFSVAQATGSRYRFFEFCGDFDAGTGSFAEKPAVSVPPFDNGLGPVTQPGVISDNLATLAFFTSYRASHRVVQGTGHRLALAHTVDAGGDRAGMRWAVLDVDNYDGIALVDTGTHAPADGFERWMGSVTLDAVGNLGLGYTRGGNGEFTSVFYTGREVGDPAGQVQQEVACVAGTGAQTGGGGRWGDYASTSIDPADGCTFWTTQEYVKTTGNFQWNTRVCSFSFDSCDVQPVEYGLSEADPGVAGQANTWTATGGTPSRFQVLYQGRNPGETPIALGSCSTTLGLANARLTAVAVADAEGTAELSRTIPALASGTTLRYQAVDLTACEVSNIVETTFQ